ncbi:MAG: hypothetical protein HYR84_03980 [Planctomycetes bacterium]|nr:hypothetical protein [Planctomycetota bacterium]
MKPCIDFHPPGPMNSFWTLNLIHFLDFYFALLFFAGIVRRWGQYHSVGNLVVAGPNRWPNLLKLVSEYRTIFWTWSMILPALLALGLWLLQMAASRFVFPQAGSAENALTVGRLVEFWPALLIIAPLGLAMAALDVFTLYAIGQFDQEQLEKHFDEAEYWLRSKTAHVVRVVSFGFINPRRMVAEEVEKALVDVGDMLNFTLWWVSVQIGLRLAFALSLWLTWALT